MLDLRVTRKWKGSNMATASFINVETFDLNGISAKMRLPVTAAPVPAGYAAYVDAVTLALFGSGLPGLAGVKSASIEIDLGAATRTPSGVMDVRNKWQATLNTAALAGSRLSIPGRNPLAALVTPGSEILAALLSSPWPAAFAALQGAAAKRSAGAKPRRRGHLPSHAAALAAAAGARRGVRGCPPWAAPAAAAPSRDPR